jgi:hypothetical protein
MNLELSDLDTTVSRDKAAELLGVCSTYIQQLCKSGEIHAQLVRGRGPRQTEWTNIATMDLIVLAATRHAKYLSRGGKRVATPEEIVAALPARCPRCDILSDGLCESCRADLAGAPYYARREDVAVFDCMAGSLVEE